MSRRFPREALGEIVAGACVIALLVVLLTDGASEDLATVSHSMLYVLLISGAFFLCWARITGLAASWMTAAGLGIAVIGLSTDELLVLGRWEGELLMLALAITFAAGIAYGGWLALAIDTAGASRSRRGELMAAVGALLAVSSYLLPYALHQKGWQFINPDGHLSVLGYLLAALVGIVLLILLARLAKADLGVSPAGGLVLALVGMILAEQLVFVHGLIPATLEAGYFVAVVGALAVIAGGLLALFDARPGLGSNTDPESAQQER